MLKNALNMSELCFIILILSVISVCKANYQLIVTQNNKNIEWNAHYSVIEGVNVNFTCRVSGFDNKKLAWGRRSKTFRFENEEDLRSHIREHSDYLYNLHNNNSHIGEVYKSFTPIRISDRGVYFCMSYEDSLFKIVHIKVSELTCTNRFKCAQDNICINLHYVCDGIPDCFDGSDEDYNNCSENPCEGKVMCPDGRCIPQVWCCDKRTDRNCTANVRHSCCSTIIDPYDPTHYYETTKNDREEKDVHRGGSSRYVFIIICVISGIFSFIIFLCIISRMCSLDSSRRPSRSAHNQSICEHSDCAIRRQLTPNTTCIYSRVSHNIQTANLDNNNDVDDPLISISLSNILARHTSDLPPSYSEIVGSSISISKPALDDDEIAPPPPYSSTKYFNDTEISNTATNNSASENDENTNCDIGNNVYTN